MPFQGSFLDNYIKDAMLSLQMSCFENLISNGTSTEVQLLNDSNFSRVIIFSLVLALNEIKRSNFKIKITVSNVQKYCFKF